MGLPISRWADRGNRVTIVSLTTALWGVAVALCGVAGTFVQLMLIRIGVAVGEAGCLPSAMSFIPEYFSRAERPRAVAIYMQGAALSMVLGYFVAGWLNQFYGWRVTFVLLGLPGLFLAIVSRLTLREPRAKTRLLTPSTKQLSLGTVCLDLWSNRTFRQLLLFYAVAAFFNFGIMQWQPALLVRSYGVGTGELGTYITIVCGTGMVVGTYIGGEWAARHAANNERLQLRTMAIAYGSVSAITTLFLLSPNRFWAFGCMGLSSLVSTMTTGPLFGTIQTLVPARVRATAITLTLLVANLIGGGLGPLVTGVMSDLLRPWTGDASLRGALLLLCPGYLWAASHLWCASKTVTRDLASATE
jgi:MFS family permease